MLSTPTPAQRVAPPNAHTMLAETVAAPNGAATLVRSLSVSMRQGSLPPVSSARGTVLPRIEVKGENAELVFDGKERFERLRLLGEGGLGEVLGAQDHDIGRKVAIKRLKPSVRSPAAMARFVDEIRTIGKLEHPNIIPIHDVGMDDGGELYFVMKYVDGETLETIIEKLVAGDPQTHQQYNFERRVEIFRALLEALAFAHDRGIVHRDIKPANVMVGKFGEVLLMDWGIAKSLHGDGVELPSPAQLIATSQGAVGDGGAQVTGNGSSQTAGNGASAISGRASRAFETQVGSLVGTPLYMCPEQASGLPTDFRSDIYSVCVLFAELLYLKHPHAGTTTLDELLKAVRSEPFDIMARSNPYQPPVPAELGWLLKRGLEKDPNKRYPSMRAILDILDRRANGDINVQCAVTLMKSATLKSGRFADTHPGAFMLGVSLFALFFIALLAAAIRGIA